VENGLANAKMIAKYGNGTDDIDFVRMDPVTNILANIDSEHYHMHEGEHYFFKSFIADAGGIGSVSIFSFTTPNTATRIHAKAVLSPDVDYTVTIFEDATVTGGTPLDGINNDRDSLNIAELTAVSEPTITVPGTAIWTARNGGGKDPIGVAPGFNYEIIAKTNSTYVFTLVKNIAQVGIVDIDFWWYEEAPKH
jgi:hypothetical protein